MPKYSFQAWLNRCAWLAGFILLFFIKEYLEQELTETFVTVIYQKTIFAFLTGMYLSCLFLENKQKRMDVPFFCLIFLPSLFLTVLSLLPIDLPLPFLPKEWLWLALKLNKDQMLALLAGLTFLPSLFMQRNRPKGR